MAEATGAMEARRSRIIHCEDAVAWLQRQPVLVGTSFVTSLPDVSELSTLSLDEWKAWFVNAASLVLARCPDDGVSIFFQTDIKHQGTWVDKAYLVQKAAEQTGHTLLWHKCVCRVPPGIATFSRPAYSHMLCFSRSIRLTDLSRSSADVLPAAGEVTWARGMATEACAAACRFVLQNTTTRCIVDPFCGHGTVLAVANELGMDAIGVELSPKRARQAERLAAPGLVLCKGNKPPPDGSNSTSNSRSSSRSRMGQGSKQEAEVVASTEAAAAAIGAAALEASREEDEQPGQQQGKQEQQQQG
jgi:hypothetical protein